MHVFNTTSRPNRFLRDNAAIILIVLAAAGLRLLVAPFSAGHFDNAIMQTWSQALTDHPLGQFYGLALDVPKDHLPGDLWLLYALGTLAGGTPSVAVLRLLAGGADLAIGILVYTIARRCASPLTAALAAGVFLLGPAPILISSLWGQWDAISTALLMAAVLLALRGRHVAIGAWIVLAYACLIKPQLAIVAPFLLVLAWRREKMKGIGNAVLGAAGGAVFVQGVAMPFGVGWPGTGQALTVPGLIQQSVDQYNAISLGAHNVWGLLIGRAAPPADGELLVGGMSYRTAGMIAFVTVWVVALAIAILIRDAEAAFFLGSSIALVAMFVFQTRMHERYLFPAPPFILLAAVPMHRVRAPAIVLHLVFFLNVFITFGYWNPGLVPTGMQTDTVIRLNAIALILVLAHLIAVGLLAIRRSRVPTTTVIRPATMPVNRPMGHLVPASERG